MMNFYYDPILGLQYDYLGTFISLDISSVPNIPSEIVLEMFMKQGVTFLDKVKATYFEHDLQEITQYKLC